MEYRSPVFSLNAALVYLVSAAYAAALKRVRCDSGAAFSVSHRTKSMNPRSTSTCDSWTSTRSPTSSPCFPLTSIPSIGGEIVRTNVPFGEAPVTRSEEHTSELQSRENLVCRLLLEKKKDNEELIGRIQ